MIGRSVPLLSVARGITMRSSTLEQVFMVLKLYDEIDLMFT